MEVALWGGNYKGMGGNYGGGTVGRELYRWHCGEGGTGRTMKVHTFQVTLIRRVSPSYKGGTVGRELWWHCGEGSTVGTVAVCRKAYGTGLWEKVYIGIYMLSRINCVFELPFLALDSKAFCRKSTL